MMLSGRLWCVIWCVLWVKCLVALPTADAQLLMQGTTSSLESPSDEVPRIEGEQPNADKPLPARVDVPSEDSPSLPLDAQVTDAFPDVQLEWMGSPSLVVLSEPSAVDASPSINDRHPVRLADNQTDGAFSMQSPITMEAPGALNDDRDGEDFGAVGVLHGEKSLRHAANAPGDEVPPSDGWTDRAGSDDATLSGWWESMVNQSLRKQSDPVQLSIGHLVYTALQHSARVKVISDTPLIRDTAVVEADADFDWGVFLDTTWNDINDPVGSTLTTGDNAIDRFQDEKFSYEYGAQKKNRLGGEFSIGQKYGWENSNSLFFVPANQGTARLTLNYTQPLMRGRGSMYNTSIVVLAQTSAAAARDELSLELQSYLKEVTEAYWNLYLARATLLQRQRLLKRGEAVLQNLSVRKELDAVDNQIARARSAVATRKSQLFRAAASVKNAEGRIRALVNSPELGVLDEFELLPIDPPSHQEISVSMHDAIEAAVRNRPELHQAMKQIRAAALRLDVSRNELLPVLDFVINTYVSGLRGESSVGKALGDQFDTGSPSYSTGLRFEYPIGNRAAKARNKRRKLELRQLQHEFRNMLYVLQLETETAMRETTTTFREVQAKYQAMKAAEGELDLLTTRWQLLPGEDRSGPLLLEDLLAAQNRLSMREFGLLKAKVDYSVALVELKRATGTLLQFENISVGTAQVDGVPELSFHRESTVDDTGVPSESVESSPVWIVSPTGATVPSTDRPASVPLSAGGEVPFSGNVTPRAPGAQNLQGRHTIRYAEQVPANAWGASRNHADW